MAVLMASITSGLFPGAKHRLGIAGGSSTPQRNSGVVGGVSLGWSWAIVNFGWASAGAAQASVARAIARAFMGGSLLGDRRNTKKTRRALLEILRTRAGEVLDFLGLVGVPHFSSSDTLGRPGATGGFHEDRVAGGGRGGGSGTHSPRAGQDQPGAHVEQRVRQRLRRALQHRRFRGE